MKTPKIVRILFVWIALGALTRGEEFTATPSKVQKFRRTARKGQINKSRKRWAREAGCPGATFSSSNLGPESSIFLKPEFYGDDCRIGRKSAEVPYEVYSFDMSGGNSQHLEAGVTASFPVLLAVYQGEFDPEYRCNNLLPGMLWVARCTNGVTSSGSIDSDVAVGEVNIVVAPCGNNVELADGTYGEYILTTASDTCTEAFCCGDQCPCKNPALHVESYIEWIMEGLETSDLTTAQEEAMETFEDVAKKLSMKAQKREDNMKKKQEKIGMKWEKAVTELLRAFKP